MIADEACLQDIDCTRVSAVNDRQPEYQGVDRRQVGLTSGEVEHTRSMLRSRSNPAIDGNVFSVSDPSINLGGTEDPVFSNLLFPMG